MTPEKLTDEQVENWRNILAKGQLGPYAFIAPREQIEAIREQMQRAIDLAWPQS